MFKCKSILKKGRCDFYDVDEYLQFLGLLCLRSGPVASGSLCPVYSHSSHLRTFNFLWIREGMAQSCAFKLVPQKVARVCV